MVPPSTTDQRGSPEEAAANKPAATTTSSPLQDSLDPLCTVVDEEPPPLGTGPSQSGCSVKAIYDIISTFDEFKRKLVESIGFGGLLKFPAMKGMNRKLSGWLMGRVDAKNSSLVLPCGKHLKFFSRDLNLVFGFPASGKDVYDTELFSKKGKSRMNLQSWPLRGKNQRSIKAVEELLTRTYIGGMTKAQEDAFKVAFVVFVMSTVLVPASKHDYVHIDYWGALAQPDCIQDYNWAAYVHKRLIISAARYKADIETSGRAPMITGCDLFLQIFYLDNIKVPSCNLDHSIRPRISCYTYDRLRSMITADTHGKHDSTMIYGKSKLRAREESAYTWAQVSLTDSMDPERYTDSVLWDAVVSMVKILKIPFQAAGPLFMATSEYARKIQTSHPPSAIACIAMLVKIMAPFVDGFNYDFDMVAITKGAANIHEEFDIPETLRACFEGTKTPLPNEACRCKHRTYAGSTSPDATASPSNMLANSETPKAPPQEVRHKRARLSTPGVGKEVQHPLPTEVWDSIDYSVIKTMCRFYLLVRYIKQQTQIDLNAAPPEILDYSQLITPAEPVHIAARAKSPWELAAAWDYTPIRTPLLTSEMNTGTNSESSSSTTMACIFDYLPKYIEVMPDAARDQRIGLSEMGMDIFDALLRCFKLSDDQLYNAEGRVRWRHFFESDILAAIIGGWFDICSPCIQNQFIGPHLSFDIYNCHMLFFPCILHTRWVCYSWNLVDNKILVFDPASDNAIDIAAHTVHTHVASLLKQTLSATIAKLIPGWQHDWAAASVLPYQWRYKGKTRSNRTGVLCAYFCRAFDGKRLQPNLNESQGDIETLAEALFAELSTKHHPRGD